MIITNYLVRDNFDSGFSNMIGNRLCYGVYHDLCMYSLNLENEMMFPKLIKFYKFMFNFSIYLHCYPFRKYDDTDISMEEYYYLRQYFDYKDNIFPNIAQLKQFNYLDDRSDGTLLHGAASAGFRQMCEVLIKDGFDCQKLNRDIKHHTMLRKIVMIYLSLHYLMVKLSFCKSLQCFFVTFFGLTYSIWCY